MDAPETVTEATRLLADRGYDCQCDVRDGELVAKVDGLWQSLGRGEMEHAFRFEGTSNPADEMIVVGIHFPDADRRGTLVAAYGPDTSFDDAQILRSLTDDR